MTSDQPGTVDARAAEAEFTFRGTDRSGVAHTGSQRGDVAEFIEARYRIGWQALTVMRDGIEVGGIVPATRERRDGKTWWAESLATTAAATPPTAVSGSGRPSNDRDGRDTEISDDDPQTLEHYATCDQPHCIEQRTRLARRTAAATPPTEDGRAPHGHRAADYCGEDCPGRGDPRARFTPTPVDSQACSNCGSETWTCAACGVLREAWDQ